MKKPLIVAALAVTGLFGVGYTVGQIGGITGSSAAAAVATVVPNQGQSTQPDARGGGQDAPHADGTVTAINGNTVTISAGTDPSGSTEYTTVTTVLLNGSTRYEAGEGSGAAASKSSIKVGSYVIVEGTLSSDGKSITASSLRTNPGGPVPGR